MEKRKFRTLLRRGHKQFGGNEYIRGRISGIMYMVSEAYKDEERIGYANIECRKGFILTVEMTEEQYQLFKDIVEKKYPGLCEFDY